MSALIEINAAVPITDIKPADDNIRRSPGDLAELVASIKSLGILEPLVVVRAGSGYTVVAGHRRLAAAHEAGLEEVPVVIREFDERERVEAMLVENLQRSDLLPTEEAEAFKRLVDVGLSQREIATRIGRSQSHIAKRLALLELPDVARKALDAGGITVESAVTLGKLKEHPDAIAKLVEVALDERDATIDDWEIKRALLVVEEARGRAKVQAELDAAGVRVIDERRGHSRLSKSHFGGLDITPAKHRKESCHAAFVEADYRGKVSPVYVCTEPKRHTKSGDSTIKVKGPVSVPARANTEAADRARKLKDGRKARAAFVPALIQKRIPKDEILAFAAEQLMHSLSADAGKAASAWLGLELKKGSGPHDHLRAVRKFLEGLDNPTKVLLVCALAAGEASIGTWSEGDEGKAYKTFLADQGFKGGAK